MPFSFIFSTALPLAEGDMDDNVEKSPLPMSSRRAAAINSCVFNDSLI